MLSRLIHWYRKNKRDLPWRETPDPYKIMVSEFMLVQTTVATVTSRYLAFLKEFPTLKSLAQAPLWKIKNAWRGLGYYSRAFNLWLACKKISEMGHFPFMPSDLKALPGFGPYLAGAVSSIAFDVPAPVVDANVKRVMLRAFESDDPGLMEALLAGNRFPPSEFAQAFMELGALVCKPLKPRCGLCPIKSYCKTRGPHPLEKKHAQSQKIELLINVCRDSQGRFRLVKRHGKELFLKHGWGLPSTILTQCPQNGHKTFPHAIMKWRMHVHVDRKPQSLGRGKSRWVAQSDLPKYLFSSLWWKALKLSTT